VVILHLNSNRKLLVSVGSACVYLELSEQILERVNGVLDRPPTSLSSGPVLEIGGKISIIEIPAARDILRLIKVEIERRYLRAGLVASLAFVHVHWPAFKHSSCTLPS